MNKCPKCKKRVEFSRLFWHPAEIDWKCTQCDSFLRINSTWRLISIVIFLIVAVGLFHPVFGLNRITDNLFLLVFPLIVVSLTIIFTQKIEILEKDFIVRNNSSGIEQAILKEDWDEIKRNSKADNFTILKGE